jgi:hypothetical protein
MGNDTRSLYRIQSGKADASRGEGKKITCRLVGQSRSQPGQDVRSRGISIGNGRASDEPWRRAPSYSRIASQPTPRLPFPIFTSSEARPPVLAPSAAPREMRFRPIGSHSPSISTRNAYCGPAACQHSWLHYWAGTSPDWALCVKIRTRKVRPRTASSDKKTSFVWQSVSTEENRSQPAYSATYLSRYK